MVLITAYQDMASPEILILNSLIKQRIRLHFHFKPHQTLLIYPFNFELQIQYTLDENNLEIKYTVVNKFYITF
jgi:galactose mutarotase-like enzyme